MTRSEVLEEIVGKEQKLARLRSQESEVESRLTVLYDAADGMRDGQLADV